MTQRFTNPLNEPSDPELLQELADIKADRARDDYLFWREKSAEFEAEITKLNRTQPNQK